MKKIILFFTLIFLMVATVEARDGDELVNQPADIVPGPPATTPEPTNGPAFGLGQPWADTTDSGYCPGYQAYETNATFYRSLQFPIQGTLNENRQFRTTHTGMDIDAPVGTDVEAASYGWVVWSGFSSFGMGNLVAVTHGSGWITLYAHLSEVAVDCWDYVNVGQLIGKTGLSGQTTFPHLHFELRNGRYSHNPMSYFNQ